MGNPTLVTGFIAFSDMQIKIEIDLQPEELRRFLGLPDMAEVPGELLNLLKDRVSAVSSAVSDSPAQFVKQNIDSLKNSSTGALRKLMSGVGLQRSAPAEEVATTETKKPAKRASRRKKG
jgi:hypothetical protein